MPTPEPEPSDEELYAVLGGSACVVCAFAERAVTRYIQAVSYESLTDVDVRAVLREALGFCPRHAWKWLSAAGNPQGVAIVYRDLVRTLLRGLRERGGGRAPGLLDRLRSRSAATPWLEPSRGCPACDVQQQSEGRTSRRIARGLASGGYTARFASAYGLCLPHVRLAVREAPPNATEAILARLEAQLAALEGHLDEFLRKQDYRYQDEPIGEERSAPRDAVARLSGEEGSR